MRHFTHSKVMAWVAFDRAIRMHEEFGLDGPSTAGARIRDEIHAEVLAQRVERGEAGVRAVVRLDDELDASVLLMPSVGFLPADRPAVRVDGRRRSGAS